MNATSNQDKVMTNELISVIIPVYNVEKYLPACLDSLLAQTYPHWQAVCVNDGSTDGSLQILRKYAAKDSRFVVAEQNNQGMSMARNNGLKQATGDWIYFLDSDDCLHPQCFESVCQAAQQHQAELVCFGFLKNKTGHIEPREYDLNKIKAKVTKEPLFCQTNHGRFRISFNVWSRVYKRELLKDLQFIPKINFEDYPYTYAVLARHPKTVVLDAKFYFYTINPKSISRVKSTAQSIKDFMTGLDFVLDTYQKSGTPKEQKFVERHLIPLILAEELRRCQATEKDTSSEIWRTFAQHLISLRQKGLLHWRGHKLKHYFAYLKLLKAESKRNK